MPTTWAWNPIDYTGGTGYTIDTNSWATSITQTVTAFQAVTTAATNVTVAFNTWADTWHGYDQTTSDWLVATDDGRVEQWVYDGISWTRPVQISQEEADRRLAETRARQHRNAVLRAQAIKKGRRLLTKLLTEEQLREYAQSKSFTVIGADGKLYRLRKGGTTHELGGDGVAIMSHCIHLDSSYIDEDTLIALKLMLETDVGEFRKIANSTPLEARDLVLA